MKRRIKNLIVNNLIFRKGIEFIVFYIDQYRKDLSLSLSKQQAQIDPTCKITNIIIDNNLKDKTKISIAANSMIVKAHLLTYAHGGEISIGEYCFIGEGAKIWSAKKIKIGNRVLISHGVNIHDN